MQDQIRRVLDDLTLLSQAVSGSTQDRIRGTIARFQNILEESNESISVYRRLSCDVGESSQKNQQVLRNLSAPGMEPTSSQSDLIRQNLPA